MISSSSHFHSLFCFPSHKILDQCLSRGQYDSAKDMVSSMIDVLTTRPFFFRNVAIPLSQQMINIIRIADNAIFNSDIAESQISPGFLLLIISFSSILLFSFSLSLKNRHFLLQSFRMMSALRSFSFVTALVSFSLYYSGTSGRR